MKKFPTFASKIRANALLCAGAAVLLSACGAGTTDPVTGQALQTAAVMSSSADQAPANNVAGPAANIESRYGADSAGESGTSDAAGSAANIYGADSAGQSGTGNAAGSPASSDPQHAADAGSQAPANSGGVAPAIADAAAATAAPAPAAETVQAGNTQPGADGSALAVQTAGAAGNIVQPGANAADPAANAGTPR